MIEQDTVFVLGAGASNPYGFPVGAELNRLICGKRPDNKTYSLPVLLQETSLSKSEVEEFVRAFERSAQSSIDAFIESRPQFDWPGRVAIAKFLCQHEDPHLAFDPGTEGNWYKALWRDMTNPKGNSNTAASNVKCLTFNYDRSLEHFLFIAARHTFDKITDQEAYQFLKKIPIEHVYGELGRFHYLPGDGIRQYSNELTARDLGTAANGIHLVGAGRKDAALFQKAREWFMHADVICFLGFGFDHTNVDRLGLEDVLEQRATNGRGMPRIIASALGKKPAQIAKIVDQLCPSAPESKLFWTGKGNLETLELAGLVR